ncbi:MAG: hypothetical protein JSS75_07985 [Bacteroidetes bacterium]|nr:hypothetical protein [Bacteroidota bacterium]
MKIFRISLMYALVFAQTTSAQTVKVDSLALDDLNHTLTLRGSGLLSGPMQVYVTDSRLPILSASDSAVTYSLPDYDRGCAGNITIFREGDTNSDWSIGWGRCALKALEQVDRSVYEDLGPNAADYPPQKYVAYTAKFRVILRDGIPVPGKYSLTLGHMTFVKWDFGASLWLHNNWVESYTGSGTRYLEVSDLPADVLLRTDSVFIQLPSLGGLHCTYSYYYDSRSGRMFETKGATNQSAPGFLLSGKRVAGLQLIPADSATSVRPFWGGMTSGTITSKVFWEEIGVSIPYGKPVLLVPTESESTIPRVGPRRNPMRSAFAELEVVLESTAIVCVQLADISGRIVYREQRVLGPGSQSINFPNTLGPGLYFYHATIGSWSSNGKFLIN